MNGPTISVVIPTFNGERFIADSVLSVLTQSYHAHEVIVVIDGSRDQTSTRLHQFGDRIRVLKKDNGGVSSARNAGANLATGDYIAFLDDDDLWHQDKLQRYVDALQAADKNEPLLLFSNFKRKDAISGREYPLTNTDLNPYLFKYVELLAKSGNTYFADKDQAFALLLRGYPIYPSTIMLSRSLFDEMRWPQEFKLSEDLLFSLHVSREADFIYIDEALSIIHRHDKNASINLLEMLDSDIKVLQWAQRETVFSTAHRAKIRRALGQKFCGLGWHYRKERKRGAALAIYLSALPYPGARIKAARGILATLLPDLSGPIQSSSTDVNPPNHR